MIGLLNEITLEEDWVYHSKDAMFRLGNDVFEVCCNPTLLGEVLTGDSKDKYYGWMENENAWKRRIAQEKGIRGNNHGSHQIRIMITHRN